MDSYVGPFMAAGGSFITLAKGNRGPEVREACKKYGGFYLGSVGGPAARLAQDCIKKVELLEYPELGMEAIWRIEVVDFPAFIVVDDKGNDFFAGAFLSRPRAESGGRLAQRGSPGRAAARRSRGLGGVRSPLRRADRRRGARPRAAPGEIEDLTQDVFVRLCKDDFRLLRSYDPARAVALDLADDRRAQHRPRRAAPAAGRSRCRSRPCPRRGSRSTRSSRRSG